MTKMKFMKLRVAQAALERSETRAQSGLWLRVLEFSFSHSFRFTPLNSLNRMVKPRKGSL